MSLEISRSGCNFCPASTLAMALIFAVCPVTVLADEGSNASRINQIATDSVVDDTAYAVRVSGCDLSIHISYPGQCIPGSEVGMAGKEILLNLVEFEGDLRVGFGGNSSEEPFVEFSPKQSTERVFAEANHAQAGVVFSGVGTTLDRQNLISETVERILQSSSVRSRTLVKSCTGAIVTTAPGLHETRISISSTQIDNFKIELESYMKTFCQ